MQRGKRGWLWIPLLALVSVGAWLVFTPAPPLGPHSAHDVAEARLRAVKRASAATIDGAHMLAVGHPSQSQGDRSASGDLVTYVMLYRRRHDLAGVAMDDRRGGPVEALLDLAKRQASTLAEAGFLPMRAEWSTVGDEGRRQITDPEPEDTTHDAMHRRPKVRVVDRHQSASGGGGGETRIDLNAPGITHYRMYVVPLSGATLFVRNHFDTATTTVASEFSYTDRTLFGVEYPTGSYIVGRQPGHYRLQEQIVHPD